jgi:hypothetical protein
MIERMVANSVSVIDNLPEYPAMLANIITDAKKSSMSIKPLQGFQDKFSWTGNWAIVEGKV